MSATADVSGEHAVLICVSPQAVHGARMAAPHVLVVEDDPKMAAIIERCLALASYETEIAATGDQALWAVLHHSPAAMVLDVMIPHPSGIEVCRHLRRRGWGGPVIVVSARSSPADREAAFRAGADAFLGKPFPLSELLSTVDQLLAGRGSVT